MTMTVTDAAAADLAPVDLACLCGRGNLETTVWGGFAHTDSDVRCDVESVDTERLMESLVEAVDEHRPDVARAYATWIAAIDGGTADRFLTAAAAA